MKPFKQYLEEAAPATITQLQRLEIQLDREEDSKKAQKLEDRIFKLFAKIAKSQKLIDAFEKEYGMEFEFDG